MGPGGFIPCLREEVFSAQALLVVDGPEGVGAPTRPKDSPRDDRRMIGAEVRARVP